MDSESTPPSQERFYWTLALAAFVLATAVIFVANDTFYRDFQRYFSGMQVPSSGEVRSKNMVRVTIDFGNGTRRAFEGQVAAGMTALVALRASAEAGQFGITLDNRGRLVGIAGVMNRGGKIWQFDLNGSPAQSLAGETELSGGERIMFSYE